MKTVTPSIFPGFMELLPQEQADFNWMIKTIQDCYENAGFMAIDTPILEKAEVLLAKGGGETEKQVYRFTKGDKEHALRFDLTVPLARYVAQHYSELTFPFRRYQIGKVFRGERNQRGRFREFYQCDIDIIGQGELSLVNDAEILSVINTTFRALGFEDFTIRINNRKILQGFLKGIGVKQVGEVIRILDKLEKIGRDSVIQELAQLNLGNHEAFSLLELVELRGSNAKILSELRNLKISEEEYQIGVEELGQVMEWVKCFKIPERNVRIDLSIARGLDYYTGTVYETILNDYPQLGSVCSGGRYDNLAEYYTNQKLPGVGISIGLTRLFYQLNEANFFDEERPTQKLLIIPIGDVLPYAIEINSKLREQGIQTQIQAEKVKVAKKLTYAAKYGFPWVIIAGDEEVSASNMILKNMLTGEQKKVQLNQVVEEVKH